MKWTISSGILWGMRAFIWEIPLGGRLTPDTMEYAHGQASWSSPALALVGRIGGLPGVQIYGICGASILGAFLTHRVGARRSLLVAVSPPGWYAMQPSADALASAGAGAIASRGNYSLLDGIALAALHLEAGLVVCFCRILARFGFQSWYLGMVGGILACIGEYHIQARYFLPGFVIAALMYGRKRPHIPVPDSEHFSNGSQKLLPSGR